MLLICTLSIVYISSQFSWCTNANIQVMQHSSFFGASITDLMTVSVVKEHHKKEPVRQYTDVPKYRGISPAVSRHGLPFSITQW